MGLTKAHATTLLASIISENRGIPYDAADDIIDNVQELIFEFRSGSSDYDSEDAIFTDFGIPFNLRWVFD